MGQATATVAEVAALLRTSRQTVYRLIESGDLEVVGAVRRGVPIEIDRGSVKRYIVASSHPVGDDEGFPHKVWTLEEVAARLRISQRMLEEDCRADRVPHIKRGRRRLMTAEHIRTLVEKHERRPQMEIGELKKAAAQHAAQQRLNRMLATESRRRSGSGRA